MLAATIQASFSRSSAHVFFHPQSIGIYECNVNFVESSCYDKFPERWILYLYVAKTITEREKDLRLVGRGFGKTRGGYSLQLRKFHRYLNRIGPKPSKWEGHFR